MPAELKKSPSSSFDMSDHDRVAEQVHDIAKEATWRLNVVVLLVKHYAVTSIIVLGGTVHWTQYVRRLQCGAFF